MTIKEKLNRIAKEIYGASEVVFTKKAETSLQAIAALGGDSLPVCVAKTQYSLSDDPTLLGRPEGFKITIKDLRLSNGAGFVVAYAGDIMIMPGLPKIPAATKLMWIITEWFPVYFNDMIRKEVFPCHNF